MNKDDDSIYEQLTETIKERLLNLDTEELKPEKVNKAVDDIAILVVGKFLELLSDDMEYENIPVIPIGKSKHKNIFYKRKRA